MELGSLVSVRLAEFQSGRGGRPHLIIRGKVHERTVIGSMVEIASRTPDPQRTITMTNRTWLMRARKIDSKQKMFYMHTCIHACIHTHMHVYVHV